MSTHRLEVLGRVPNGLTHNDVFASFLSLMKEADSEAVVTKRRLSGNIISLIVTFEAPSATSAVAQVNYAAHGITNFSYDLIRGGGSQ